jgi:purine-binding chemotaxis protein CheW
VVLELNNNVFQSGDFSGASQWDTIGESLMLQAAEQAQIAARANSGIQHLGFLVGSESFLLEVKCVREIIMLPTITYVPQGPKAVEGIFALRGEIMPVLNLARFWEMRKSHGTNHTRVVILQAGESGFGLVVDEITDFVSLEKEQIESVPSTFFAAEYAVLEGVAKWKDKVQGVLSVEKLVTLLPCSESNQESEDVQH